MLKHITFIRHTAVCMRNVLIHPVHRTSHTAPLIRKTKYTQSAKHILHDNLHKFVPNRQRFVCLFSWRYNPLWLYFHSPVASSCSRFLDHTQRPATVGRTPLDEWSIRRRDLYLTTHNTQQTNIHAPCGIRTHNLSRRAAEDLRPRPRGHWDRHMCYIHMCYIHILNPKRVLYNNVNRVVIHGIFLNS
jgi:hypothetical protein